MKKARLVINLRDVRPIWSITDQAIAEVRAGVPERFEVVVVDEPTEGRGDGGSVNEEALAAVRGAEVHLGFGFPEPLFSAAEGTLRWVHSAAAGVGGALYPGMLDSDVQLTNSAGIHAEPMAETILACILYFARGLDLALAAQRRREWDPAPFEALDTPVRELPGSVLGILGYGGIGQATARRGAALGMKVLAHRRTQRPAEPGVEQLTGPEGLERIIRAANYLVLSLPHTPATDNILNAERIANLRPDAVVINVGRGALIDEAALTCALEAAAIRGAALDVFRNEPLESGSPFWDLDNVLVMPHTSPTTDRFWRREVDLILENLRRYEAGEPLLNLVDKQAGY